MLKVSLTALATAVLCFAIAAATGFARAGARSYTLKVGDRAVFSPVNFQCQALSKTQVACGSLTKITSSVNVYYSRTQVAVVRYGKTLNAKGTLLFQSTR
jgi:hypothetical protein